MYAGARGNDREKTVSTVRAVSPFSNYSGILYRPCRSTRNGTGVGAPRERERERGRCARLDGDNG